MGRTWTHQCAVLTCDNCGSSYERKINNEFWNRVVHFCKRTCFSAGIKVGGAADNARKRTCLKRFGVEHPMLDATNDYHKRRDATMMSRYGNVCPTKSDIVKSKTKATCQDRFGVPYPMMNTDVKTKMVESLLKNDMQEIAVKRFETMKRNNSFQKSRAEDHMYALLTSQFSHDDVERNKRPVGTAWPIDFYVKSINTWIQVDGVYWHGLDGQLDNHRLTMDVDKRSKIIVYKWETDRKQERWFAEHNMKLIRVTDKETLKMNVHNVQSLFACLQVPASTVQLTSPLPDSKRLS